MRSILLLLVCSFPISAFAIQGEFLLSGNIVQAYRAASRLNLQEAEVALALEKKVHPGNGFSYLVANYCDFLRVFLEDDPLEYRKALARKALRLENLEICDNSSPFYRYSLAEIHLQWTFLRFQQGDQAKAAKDLRKASIYLQENQQRFPDFVLNKKGLALVHILAGSIPENMQWLSRLAGIRGTVSAGETELNEVIHWVRSNHRFHFLLPEMLFFRQMLKINLLTEDHIIPISESVDSVRKKEPLLVYIDLLLAQKTQRSADVLKLLADFPDHFPGIRFCFIHYLRAEAKMNLGFPDNSEFQSFLKCSQGTHFHLAALRRMAWMELLQGNKSAYQAIMKQIQIAGNARTEEDKQALLEAQSVTVPDTALIRARLLFDGGKAPDAIELLLNVSTKGKSTAFLSERSYRLGRCYQWIGNESEALKWFTQSRNTGATLHEYFAASAAYQSGKIYVHQKRFSEAQKAFLHVSQYPNHPYKGSLDAKAKTALRKINR